MTEERVQVTLTEEQLKVVIQCVNNTSFKGESAQAVLGLQQALYAPFQGQPPVAEEPKEEEPKEEVDES